MIHFFLALLVPNAKLLGLLRDVQCKNMHFFANYLLLFIYYFLDLFIYLFTYLLVCLSTLAICLFIDLSI